MADETADTASPRDLWLAIEPIHAVIYFAPDIHAALAEAGPKGFWMSYFGARAAPMGAVTAGVVQATFFNFEPAKVARAVPEVWSLVSPERLLDVRRAACGALLAEVTSAVPVAAVAAAAELLEEAASAVDTSGRALAAANRLLPAASDPHERLWQATTTLREHRGDGHVAMLVANGLDGVEVHVLQAAAGVVPRERLQAARGWADDQWEAAAGRLVDRGWIDGAGTLTAAGLDGRAAIEAQTDALAAVPGVDLAAVVAACRPITDAVAGADVIAYPNPIGLPAPGAPR